MCSIFFSRPPSMTLALDSLEQRHLLKNTVSTLACKKKMHVDEFFLCRQPYFRYIARSTRQWSWSRSSALFPPVPANFSEFCSLC